MTDKPKTGGPARIIDRAAYHQMFGNSEPYVGGGKSSKVAQAALDALAAAGYVIVPKEPTQKMNVAGASSVAARLSLSQVRKIFQAMLAAGGHDDD